MKPKISEDPKNCRISTYLTKDEAEMLAEKIGTQSTASWLRKLLLNAIYGENTAVYIFEELDKFLVTETMRQGYEVARMRKKLRDMAEQAGLEVKWYEI